MIKGILLNIILFLILDSIWLKAFIGDFFLKQLSEIARINPDGQWDVRLFPAALVYLLMGASVEIFLVKNKSVETAKQYFIQGALLGLIIYGVFDLTNRAILEQYPMAFVIVDISWGTFLFGSVSYLNFLIKQRFSFFG